MNEAEIVLRRQKEAIDREEVPAEMEERLRDTLMGRRKQLSRRMNWKVTAAAALLIFSLLGYHADTLAYYGNKLLGYDQIMTGALRELNELGKGQPVGRSYTFRNGTTVTLDGIMLDGNQTLVFYTVGTPAGNADKVNVDPFLTIKGMLGEYRMESASGITNETNTETKYIALFPPPYFFEKNLELRFSLAADEERENGFIKFTLDRRRAMGYTLKKAVNQTIVADGTSIRFETISASPMSTVLRGTIQTPLELTVDQIRGERIFPGELEISLLADGKEIARRSGGMTTDLKGITFKQEFDALPDGLRELEARLVRFGAEHVVGEQFALPKGELPAAITVLGQSITVNAVREARVDTFVTITSEESVILSKVRLLLDGAEAGLEETIDSSYEKMTDGTILHTRTLHFPGIGEEMRLDIRRMKYAKNYDERISIPVE